MKIEVSIKRNLFQDKQGLDRQAWEGLGLLSLSRKSKPDRGRDMSKGGAVGSSTEKKATREMTVGGGPVLKYK